MAVRQVHLDVTSRIRDGTIDTAAVRVGEGNDHFPTQALPESGMTCADHCNQRSCRLTGSG